MELTADPARLPPGAAAYAAAVRAPRVPHGRRVSLHDGRLKRLAVDPAAGTAAALIHADDGLGGRRRVTLVYENLTACEVREDGTAVEGDGGVRLPGLGDLIDDRLDLPPAGGVRHTWFFSNEVAVALTGDDFTAAWTDDDAGVIRFRGPSGPYGELSNYAKFPVEIGGLTYPTAEHYVQSQKFAGTPHAGVVRAARSAAHAARLGRDRPPRADWEAVRDGVTRTALRAKFAQHADARAVLLATGDAELRNAAGGDPYRGDGGDGTGGNRLGELLMEVRADSKAAGG